jgi:hypothetical protein
MNRSIEKNDCGAGGGGRKDEEPPPLARSDSVAILVARFFVPVRIEREGEDEHSAYNRENSQSPTCQRVDVSTTSFFSVMTCHNKEAFKGIASLTYGMEDEQVGERGSGHEQVADRVDLWNAGSTLKLQA